LKNWVVGKSALGARIVPDPNADNDSDEKMVDNDDDIAHGNAESSDDSSDEASDDDDEMVGAPADVAKDF
jgi:hypothetical protein